MYKQVIQSLKAVKSIFIIGVIYLIGCSSIEYRSDVPIKKPLQSLTNVDAVGKKIWTVSIGSGVVNDNVKLELAKEGDVLFAADPKGIVVAINRLTGKKLWKQNIKMQISSGPAAGDKIVVVGGNESVVALNSSNGEILWRTPVTSEVLVAPKIKDEIVLICTLDGGLVALNAQDGHQLWRFVLTPPSLVLRRGSVPVITKDHIIAGFSSGKLVVINKANGVVNWSADVSSPKGRSDIQRMIDISTEPVIKDDVVYAVNYQGNLKAFSLQTGQVIWEREVSSYSGILADNKNIYVSDTNGDVLAFELHTGSSAWIQTALHGRILSAPVLQGRFIVVADEDGCLHWINREQGQLSGRYKATGKNGIEATPIVYSNLLYVYGRDGTVSAVSVDVTGI